ncbi:hypothetical protein F4859DRAFT_440724 [Xylaria cf. heliscus]|nr:hypothetical protein F4859DRAFT_440724 [Xylaria cf. heliscus]
MATLPRLEEDLHSTLADILSIPSLSSYSRALSMVEEVSELADSSPDTNSAAILRSCEDYRVRFEEAICRLTTEASAYEHMVYERASCNKSPSMNVNVGENVTKPQQKNKRRGVFFNMDKGEHVVAALEALRLEEFLEEQERKIERKVHFS